MNEPLTPRMKQEEPSSELVTSVFVYGTLKSGGPVRGLDSFPVDHRELQGKAKTTYPDYHKINVETSIGPAKMYIMDIESAQSWAREPVNAIKDGDTFIWNL